jgi:hypothetical protein
MNTEKVLCGQCKTTPMVLSKDKYGPVLICEDSACDGTHRATEDGHPCGIPADRVTRSARRKVMAICSGISKIYNMPYWLAMEILRRTTDIRAGVAFLTHLDALAMINVFVQADPKFFDNEKLRLAKELDVVLD